ncbi:MAG TPA: GAF domain-containing protein [Gaiellaceae bacterium]|jgi:signal transduction histidine kinase|nr:GAF domain-containing protein [Gaiellaceae bacterium]
MGLRADQRTGDVDRLRLLLDAGIALSSELSLDALLQRIVETAAKLTGARYAALAVVDRSGRSLERFVTTGMDEETIAAIGELPRGRGVLGVVIREQRPLRLDDLAADPRSVGFPPGHPPMTTFLGVPILLRGVAYGNLYLTEKEGGEPFTEEDEELTQLLAAQAAVAIENARLYESATRWLRQLESLSEIGDAIASQIELDRILAVVADRLRELVAARLVLIALPDQPEILRVSAASGEGAEQLLGLRLELHASKAGRVLERGRSERIDALLDDPEVDQRAARLLGATTALYVPLTVRGKPIGVVVAHDKEGPDPRFGEDDLRLAETLTARAATAVDLSERVSRDVVRRVVAAQELERRHLARELHDETGQALTSILLELKALEPMLESEAGRAAVAALRERVVSTLQGVRRLAVELRPAALDDFGLATALERLAETIRERASLQLDLELQLGEERLPGEIETTLYRIVQEALTNIVRHAQATRVSVVLRRAAGAVTAVVEDDGAGFDPAAQHAGLGLVGMRERAALAGGRLTIEAAPGRGTTIVAEVPLP